MNENTREAMKPRNLTTKQSIEEAILLALVAINGAKSINEPTTARVTEMQDPEESAGDYAKFFLNQAIGLIEFVQEHPEEEEI